MDPYGDIWGAPFPYYGQVGPFIAPQAPPTDGPFDGTLVSLPCINPEWLRILLGAADVLRNPSSWAPVTESTLSIVLQRVDELKGQLSEAASCVNPITALAFDCTGTGLVATFADGAESTVISPAQFCTCARGCITPTTPVPVTGQSTPQNACGIATYLGQELFQQFMQVMANARQANDVVAKWVTDIVTAIAAVNPILEIMALFVQNAYNTSQPQSYLDMQDAQSNTALWVNMKCAIFNAIKAQGYVTASNFASVATAIAGISYTHPWIVAMMSNMWTDLGLFGIQKLQDQGALTVGDCSTCGSWCWQMDFTVGPSGWSVISGLGGVWVGGAGWETSAGTQPYECAIEFVFPTPLTITEANLTFCTNFSAPHPDDRKWVVNAHGGGSTTFGIDLAARPSCAHSSTGPISILADSIFLVMRNETGGGPIVIPNAQFKGVGANPFGVDNCTY